ncbi:hypothetical protein H4219_006448, partial [Mycoemilia scoparia]
MDDTVVTLSSPSFYPLLNTALLKYCSSTGAAFNSSKTEILTTSVVPDSDLHFLPVTPTPPGQAIRYLGGYIGKSINHTHLGQSFLDNIVDHARKVAPIASNVRDRASLLATYSIPKITFIANFVSFSTLQIATVDKALSSILWGDRKPYLNPQITALPSAQGGLRFPTVASIIRATRFKFLHSFRSTYLNPGRAPILRSLWVENLLDLWRSDVQTRRGTTYAKIFT